MPTNWKISTPFAVLLSILIFQLAFSVGCFYGYYKFHSIAADHAVNFEKLKTKLNNSNCDCADKDIVLRVAEASVKDTDDWAKMFIYIGFIVGWSAGGALFSLFSLRKQYAEQKSV